jgi:hypothetical protein
MSKKGDVFQPGSNAPISGIYQVIHDKLDGEHHAHTHRVLILSGTRFPPCRGCGGSVTFLLGQPEEHIAENEHFTGEPLFTL